MAMMKVQVDNDNHNASSSSLLSPLLKEQEEILTTTIMFGYDEDKEDDTEGGGKQDRKQNCFHSFQRQLSLPLSPNKKKKQQLWLILILVIALQLCFLLIDLWNVVVFGMFGSASRFRNAHFVCEIPVNGSFHASTSQTVERRGQ